MGYHIFSVKGNSIDYTYADNEIELAKIDTITEDSFIYQGEKHWAPTQVKNDERLKNYSEDWFRAGIKAQELFKKQAKDRDLILEELYQDRNSFQQYRISGKHVEIKRGDYLIRNLGNIEIDVKCRTLHVDGDEKIFYFKCKDVQRHLNMQKYTNTPVLIAVYERLSEDIVRDDIPYFISIDKIKSNENFLEKTNIKQENTGWCYQVPLTMTSQTFEYIKEIYNQMSNRKSYSYEEKRCIHPNAYKRWTVEDDEQLEKLYCEDASIESLSEIFGRNKGSIYSRIKKLELDQKYRS